jgi:hypothetical protein
MKIGYEHSNKLHMKYCFYFFHNLFNDTVRNSYGIELKVLFISQQLQSCWWCLFYVNVICISVTTSSQKEKQQITSTTPKNKSLSVLQADLNKGNT